MQTAAVVKRKNRATHARADRILKVNHAGEHGAVNIYRGQILICRWRAKAVVERLKEFQSHEEAHRDVFARELERRQVRRCRSFALCGLGGFALGVITGLCGSAAVAATTSAVERVVLRHLDDQLAYLNDSDMAAHRVVSAILEDEKAHFDWGEMHGRQGKIWRALLEPIVSVSTETVIWLGMRL